MTQAFDGKLDKSLKKKMAAAGLRYGISIGRRAPLHKMHIDCIREIYDAGLTPVIIVGSVNEAGDPLYDPLRNPLTYDQQVDQLRRALPAEIFAKSRILPLKDVPDDAVWMQNLQKLLAENNMLGQSVMHFRAKAADAATVQAARCKPLSQYKKDLLAAGVAVWQSYNSDPADDAICASDIRRYDLGHLTTAQQEIAPTAWGLGYTAHLLREGGNPDGAELTGARLPLTMLDHTLKRLYDEAGIRTRDILTAARLKGTVSLESVMAATQEKIDALKRKPMILVGPRMGQEAGAAYASDDRFDFIPASVGSFGSGETFTELFYGENDDFEKNAARLKDAHVFIVQSTAAPVGDNVQHLLHMIHTAKFYGAARVTVALPFAAYARQDRAFDRRFASVGADMLPKQLKAAGADAVITVTLHSKAAMAFYQQTFGRDFTHVTTADLLARHLQSLGLEGATTVVGAPDGGNKPDDEGIARAMDVRGAFQAAAFKISKEHVGRTTRVTAFEGDVAGKTAVVVDDMVDGGSTLINAARVLKQNGAKQVVCCVTHGILSEWKGVAALEKLLTANENGAPLIDRFVVTDSVPDVREKFNALAAKSPDLAARVDILPLAPLLADAMQARKVAGARRRP